mgnify:CR=1 FL=1
MGLVIVPLLLVVAIIALIISSKMIGNSLKLGCSKRAIRNTILSIVVLSPLIWLGIKYLSPEFNTRGQDYVTPFMLWFLEIALYIITPGIISTIMIHCFNRFEKDE